MYIEEDLLFFFGEVVLLERGRHHSHHSHTYRGKRGVGRRGYEIGFATMKQERERGRKSCVGLLLAEYVRKTKKTTGVRGGRISSGPSAGSGSGGKIELLKEVTVAEPTCLGFSWKVSSLIRGTLYTLWRCVECWLLQTRCYVGTNGAGFSDAFFFFFLFWVLVSFPSRSLHLRSPSQS